jgi:hypothetical protein
MQCYRHRHNEAAEIQDSYRLRLKLKQSFGIGLTPLMPATVSMYAMFGVFLLAVGVYLAFSRRDFDYLSFAMAAVFLVMSWISYKRFRDACLTC